MNELKLELSNPKAINTRNGQKWIQTAEPSGRFWQEWKNNGESLKSQGYSVKKYNEKWIVTKWHDEPPVSKAKENYNLQAIPCEPYLKYLPYQEEGIRYAADKDYCLIADEMGLGKTIQAIGVANLTKPTTVLIVCPASLKINWRKEWSVWTTLEDAAPEIIHTKTKHLGDISIINYDILAKMEEKLHSKYWDLIIFDESHYLKNKKAKRTKVALGLEADRMLFLTGTPVLNRPLELWPILEKVGIFTNWVGYVKRYCGAYKARFGWDTKGATNTGELNDILTDEFMIRRLKKDVLEDLPSKRRQTIIFPVDAEIERLEAETWENLQAKASEIKKSPIIGFAELAKARKQIAINKLKVAIPYIDNILEQTDKIVVFAHHKAVVAKIKGHYGDSCVIMTGDTSVEDRDKAVTGFQNDDSIRIFVGTIGAAGVGITLTASSYVLFLELDWTPAKLLQAEDRCHRIGQENAVIVQYLIYEGTIEEKICSKVLQKIEVINKVVDGGDGDVDILGELLQY